LFTVAFFEDLLIKWERLLGIKEVNTYCEGVDSKVIKIAYSVAVDFEKP